MSVQPPPGPSAQELRFPKLLAEANAHVSKKNWAKAAEVAAMARSIATTDAHRSQILTLLRQLNAEADRQCKECAKLFQEKKYQQAIDGYNRISRTFGCLSLPASIAARKAAVAAMNDPAAKGALQESKATTSYASLLKVVKGQPTSAPADDAPAPEIRSLVNDIKALPADRQARAVEGLTTLVKSYPDSTAGKQAAADLDTLKADAKFWAPLQEKMRQSKAQGLLQMAQQLCDSGNSNAALRCYYQIAREYPDTPVATTAQTKIKELEKKP